MLTIHAHWDWFQADPTATELKAIERGEFAAVTQEDGDEDAAKDAVVAAVTSTGQPRVAVFRPGIGETVCVLAWDPAAVAVEWDEWNWFVPEEDED